MTTLRLPLIAVLAAGLGAGSVVGYQAWLGRPGASACRAGAAAMARLDLLFGLGLKDGSRVSEGDWQAFVDGEVTPRFPDGLTMLDGKGQWRNSAGVVTREPSRVLMVWYRPAAGSEAAIEAIRSAYKARFGQESVMRVDGTSCVSF
ncbi:MAG: DUF3574 domain-containing protein [Hyphomicrobiaceae bacterium]|nr:MAG: DUF3574 domain-containing protein [Hyphomicrobiaceae bacterium]